MFPDSVPPWVPDPLQPISEWALSPAVLGVLSLASLLFFVGSILALPWLIARLPEDYFVDDDSPPSAVLRGERAAKLSRVVRNVVGVGLLLAGVAMLVLPGQGVLTIIVALGLIEFPGKRRTPAPPRFTPPRAFNAEQDPGPREQTTADPRARRKRCVMRRGAWRPQAFAWRPAARMLVGMRWVGCVCVCLAIGCSGGTGSGPPRPGSGGGSGTGATGGSGGTGNSSGTGGGGATNPGPAPKAKWVRLFGSTSADQAFGVARGAGSDVYVSGEFTGEADFGEGKVSSKGGRDAFLVKLDADGKTVWAKQFGTSAPDGSGDLAVDSKGNVIVVASVGGALDAGTGALPFGGDRDVAVIKVAPDGTLLWARSYGAGGFDVASSGGDWQR